MIRCEVDLFGIPLPPPALYRKDGGLRRAGYAAKPGTGPKGQRCNTCRWAMKVLHRGIRSHKCELQAAQWSGAPCTDIKPGAPACSEWQRKQWKVARSNHPTHA